MQHSCVEILRLWSGALGQRIYLFEEQTGDLLFTKYASLYTLHTSKNSFSDLIMVAMQRNHLK